MSLTNSALWTTNSTPWHLHFLFFWVETMVVGWDKFCEAYNRMPGKDPRGRAWWSPRDEDTEECHLHCHSCQTFISCAPHLSRPPVIGGLGDTFQLLTYGLCTSSVLRREAHERVPILFLPPPYGWHKCMWIQWSHQTEAFCVAWSLHGKSYPGDSHQMCYMREKFMSAGYTVDISWLTCYLSVAQFLLPLDK